MKPERFSCTGGIMMGNRSTEQECGPKILVKHYHTVVNEKAENSNRDKTIQSESDM